MLFYSCYKCSQQVQGVKEKLWFFPRIFNILPPFPSQLWAAIGRSVNGEPIRGGGDGVQSAVDRKKKLQKRINEWIRLTRWVGGGWDMWIKLFSILNYQWTGATAEICRIVGFVPDSGKFPVEGLSDNLNHSWLWRKQQRILYLMTTPIKEKFQNGTFLSLWRP